MRVILSVLAACLAGGALSVSVQAQSAPAAARSPGGAPTAGPGAWRAWSSDIHDADDKEAGGAPAVRIVAARNGWFSGKVAVSAHPGLKASVGDLKAAASGTAVIPASCISVRYAVPWSGKLAGGSEAKGPDILLEAPPEETPAGRVPVWLTVKVPADAKPGTYAGELTVTAGANPPLRVPVSLEVCPWTAPAPGERRTWLELMQSPDTLAAEYAVPLWSEGHFDLIERSMRLIGEAGSRILYLPLIEQTNAGNEESMVRWKKKGDGLCEFDFSVMDRYLDAAEKHMGKPRLVVFNVWDRYLTRPGAGGRDFQTQTGLRVAASGPIVTMVDQAGGKPLHAVLPDYPPRGSVTVWIERLREAPAVADYLQKRLDEIKKNLFDFQQDKEGTAVVDGKEARWVSFSCGMGPFRMKAVVYVTVQGGRGIQITCLSQADKFDRKRETFDKISSSLKVAEKELTLHCPEGWEKAEFQYRESGVGTGVVAIVWGPGDAPTEPSPVRQAWKSLFDQLREKMKARGLEKQMLLGMVSDFWPTKEQGMFLKETSGNIPWANASHYFRKSLWDIGEGVGYHAFYFGVRFGYKGSLYGWKRPELTATFDRAAFLDGWPMARWRHMGEYSITGNVNGVGRLGADTWNVLRNKAGIRQGRVYERYRQTDWGYLNIRCSVLAPGPSGALATARYEILREGIQDCEARIVLERALTDPALRAKLGADLAKSCEEALAERTENLWKAVGANVGDARDDSWRKGPSADGQARFLASGWQDRSRKLYTLAGEVAAKTGSP